MGDSLGSSRCADAPTAGAASPTALSGASCDARSGVETSQAIVYSAVGDEVQEVSQFSRASAESHEVPPDTANADEWEMASGTRAELREGNARMEMALPTALGGLSSEDELVASPGRCEAESSAPPTDAQSATPFKQGSGLVLAC